MSRILTHPFTTLSTLLGLFIVAAWLFSFWYASWFCWAWRTTQLTTVSAKSIRFDLDKGRLTFWTDVDSVELPNPAALSWLTRPGFEFFRYNVWRNTHDSWWTGSLGESLGFQCRSSRSTATIGVGGKPEAIEMELGLTNMGRMSLPWSSHTCFLGFPAILLAIPFAVPLLYQLRARRRRLKALASALCPQCSYDLRAHQPGQKCPECGALIAPRPQPAADSR
jgi:hypothetical protein